LSIRVLFAVVNRANKLVATVSEEIPEALKLKVLKNERFSESKMQLRVP